MHKLFLLVLLIGQPLILHAQQRPKSTSATPVCENGPQSPDVSFEAAVTFFGSTGDTDAAIAKFKASGLCKLTDREMQGIMYAPDMIAKSNSEVINFGFERKAGDDYSKVRIFLDSVTDSPSTTARFTEKLSANPSCQIVYKREDADLIFHLYTTENSPGTLYLATLVVSIPAYWQGAKDDQLDILKTSPGISAGRDASTAALDIYDNVAFKQIEAYRAILANWQKNGDTGILVAHIP